MIKITKKNMKTLINSIGKTDLTCLKLIAFVKDDRAVYASNGQTFTKISAVDNIPFDFTVPLDIAKEVTKQCKKGESVNFSSDEENTITISTGLFSTVIPVKSEMVAYFRAIPTEPPKMRLHLSVDRLLDLLNSRKGECIELQIVDDKTPVIIRDFTYSNEYSNDKELNYTDVMSVINTME